MNTPSESQRRLAEALENAKKITAGAFSSADPVAPPAFVVPTFAPPAAFNPPSFVVPIVAPAEASNTPAFVVPSAPLLDQFQAHQTLVAKGLENLAKQIPPAFVVPSAPDPIALAAASIRAFGQSLGVDMGTGPDHTSFSLPPHLEPVAEHISADPINPPEAPPNDGTFGPVAAAKRVEEVEIPGGDLEALDRAAAKKICVQRGLVAASSRLGVEALRDLIRKADAGVPIERVDMSQFVPSVEEVDHNSAAPENAPRFVAGVLPSVEEAFETMDGAIRMAQNFVSQEEGEKIRRAIDTLRSQFEYLENERAIDTLRSQFEYLENERALAIQATDATSVRNALDRLNDVGDFLRAMIGA